MLTRRTSAVYTAIGVLILCVMLFPVYWMLNASLQPSGNTLTAGFLPLHPTFSGYRRALERAGRKPRHEHDHRGRDRGAESGDRDSVRVRAVAVPVPLGVGSGCWRS